MRSRASDGDVLGCRLPCGLQAGPQPLGSQWKPLLMMPVGAGRSRGAAAGPKDGNAERGIADAPTQPRCCHHSALWALGCHWDPQNKSLLSCFFHGMTAGPDRNWRAPEHSLFLHVQGASGQPAPILQFRTRKIQPENVPRYRRKAVCAPSSQHSAAQSPSQLAKISVSSQEKEYSHQEGINPASRTRMVQAFTQHLYQIL